MSQRVNPSGEGSEGEEPKDTGRQPSAYPTHPQDPWGSPRKKRRDRARASAKWLVGLLLVGVIAFGLWPRHHSPAPLNAAPAGTAAPWTAAATKADASRSASASPTPTFTNKDDQYFTGSPALNWADNEAGFVLPKAAAVNGVGSGYIAEGYQELEKLMEAGGLDATVLDGGSVSDFTKLLDPSSGTARKLNSWLAQPSYEHDPVQLVTRFNPATTRLVGHTVKVNGSMSAAAGSQGHTALLTADYVFVYVVSPVSNPSDTERVIVHRTLQIEAVNPNYYNYVAGEAWVYSYAVSKANIQCYRYDGYVDPAFGDSAQPNQTGTVDAYATGNQLTASPQPSSGSSSTQGACQAVNGT